MLQDKSSLLIFMLYEKSSLLFLCYMIRVLFSFYVTFLYSFSALIISLVSDYTCKCCNWLLHARPSLPWNYMQFCPILHILPNNQFPGSLGSLQNIPTGCPAHGEATKGERDREVHATSGIWLSFGLNYFNIFVLVL